MTHEFDRDYWESHWQQADARASGQEIAPNPYLARELGGLPPGTALDAGCGEGAEAVWLATQGWEVTAVDISSEALARAAERAKRIEASEHVHWIEADLSVWEPPIQFQLVTTHYAHPAMPQLAFYERISGWVAPGGTLLVVGHLLGGAAEGHEDSPRSHAHGHGPADEASVSAATITARLDAARWDIVTADQPARTLTDGAGEPVRLNDVVVRAIRRR